MNIKKQGVSVIKPDFSASFLDYELILNVQLKQYHIIALLLLFVCALLNHSVIALFGGFCFSYFLHDAAKTEFLSYGKKLLSNSIILLGFGMSLDQAISAGPGGLLLTMYSVVFSVAVGLLVAKAFKLEMGTGYLLSSGTAICGGSAIAAVAPAIKAEPHQISTALTVVFLLNAVALVVFPAIAMALEMTPERFALWAALAIHDTSSVIGAAQAYHPDSLNDATLVKLVRTLWIIPVVLFLSEMKGGKAKKQNFPMFILFFCLAMLIAYLFPALETAYAGLYQLGKYGVVLSLFFIGSSLNITAMKNGGLRPLAAGFVMWFVISAASLWVVLSL